VLNIQKLGRIAVVAVVATLALATPRPAMAQRNGLHTHVRFPGATLTRPIIPDFNGYHFLFYRNGSRQPDARLVMNGVNVVDGTFGGYFEGTGGGPVYGTMKPAPENQNPGGLGVYEFRFTVKDPNGAVHTYSGRLGWIIFAWAMTGEFSGPNYGPYKFEARYLPPVSIDGRG
jgi:hypothetical protein